MVHSLKDYETAVAASEILFGTATSETLKSIDEATFLSIFEGVPHHDISRSELRSGIRAVELCVDKAPVFPSKGELRKMVQNGGLSINKVKITDYDALIDEAALIDDKYLLVQRGKKNYYLLTAK